jgi:hypothetical protein
VSNCEHKEIVARGCVKTHKPNTLYYHTSPSITHLVEPAELDYESARADPNRFFQHFDTQEVVSHTISNYGKKHVKVKSVRK